jgi:glycosyltransferase A (GT-A) superfamily protein (DUF2064 family)
MHDFEIHLQILQNFQLCKTTDQMPALFPGLKCAATERHFREKLATRLAISKQGDQIGKIVAKSALVYFGQFLENNRST